MTVQFDEQTGNYGDLLRERRIAAGFSKTKLGKLSGVSQPYICQIESGKRGEPSEKMKRKFAEVLGVDMASCPYCANASAEKPISPLMVRVLEQDFRNISEAISTLKQHLRGLMG